MKPVRWNENDSFVNGTNPEKIDINIYFNSSNIEYFLEFHDMNEFLSKINWIIINVDTHWLTRIQITITKNIWKNKNNNNNLIVHTSQQISIYQMCIDVLVRWNVHRNCFLIFILAYLFASRLKISSDGFQAKKNCFFFVSL